VKEGLSQGNAALIARGATLSAWANQRILPKEELPVIFDIALSSGALGINIAHSGTVVGILYEPGTVDQKKLKALLKERYPFLSLLPARVVSGGVKVGKQNLFLPPRGELAGSPAEVRVGTR
jgi:L-threonine kinase